MSTDPLLELRWIHSKAAFEMSNKDDNLVCIMGWMALTFGGRPLIDQWIWPVVDLELSAPLGSSSLWLTSSSTHRAPSPWMAETCATFHARPARGAHRILRLLGAGGHSSSRKKESRAKRKQSLGCENAKRSNSGSLQSGVRGSAWSAYWHACRPSYLIRHWPCMSRIYLFCYASPSIYMSRTITRECILY